MKVKIALSIAATLVFTQASWAETVAAPGKTWSMSAIPGDSAARAAFNTMKAGYQLPAWVIQGGTESPATTVSFDGNDVHVMSSCEPHNCGSERMAVMYDPQKKVMYGLLLSVNKKDNTERLTWMSMGGGSESIDGKTILYAALTGSLVNHPGAFNFNTDPSRAGNSAASGICRNDAAEALTGVNRLTDEQAKKLTGATIVRQVTPNQGVTMDYRRERLTIATDPKTDKIIRATCG